MYKTILIDVDEPLAKSGEAWLSWLEDKTTTKLKGRATEYDLTKYFKQELQYEGLTGFEFWKVGDPYLNIEPVEQAFEVCNILVSEGYRLLPVSKVYTEHCCSKRKWLKRHFPMMDAPIFISMDGTKSDVRGDFIIDDRADNFKGFPQDVGQILYASPYYEYRPVETSYVTAENWWDILGYIVKEDISEEFKD